MNFILPIKMAMSHQVLSLGVIKSALLKQKRQNKKNITELQYCTGMTHKGNKKIKLKKISFIFQFSKNGSGGSVKRKIKKLWPK